VDRVSVLSWLLLLVPLPALVVLSLINAAAMHCIVLMLPVYEAPGLNTVGPVTLVTHCKLSWKPPQT